MSPTSSRTFRSRAAAAALIALMAGLSSLPAAHAAGSLPPQPPPYSPQPQPNLAINTTFITGAQKPWDIAFDTMGARDLVFTENNTGKIRSFWGGALHDIVTVGALNGATFDNGGEGGLMGIAFSPSGKGLYACVTTGIDNRVVRFGVARDGGGHVSALGAPSKIVTGMRKAGFHNGCRVRFQPGTNPPALWVTMGDAGYGPAPQSNTILNGKILRIYENGIAYSGNTGGVRWYSKGHRNPQGIAFRPVNHVPYEAEHGPNIDDEVNALRNGGNAGWAPTNGSDYDQTKPMTNLNIPGVTRPVWRSGTPSTAVTYAPSGITFLAGSQWKSWNGAIMVAFLKNSELRLLFLTGYGTVAGQKIVPGSQKGVRLRVPVQGPDGKVYVATDVEPNGAIWQLTPS